MIAVGIQDEVQKFATNKADDPGRTPMRSVGLVLAIAAFASAACAENRPNGNPVLNVRAYGAVGDGVADDRPAIQKALDDAHKMGHATVYFGPGIYNLATATSRYGQLSLTDWSKPFSIDLVGDSATLLTQQTGAAILLAEGYWQQSTIQGITFENKHPVTASETAAIDFEGGGQNGIRNWVLKNNTFRDFSRHITVSGVTGLQIANNQFLMTAGRDSGTAQDPQPNVAIWLFNNSPNGTSQGIDIVGNSFDGCSSGDLSATVSRRCADGMVYGQGGAVTVRDNVIRGFSYEGIYLEPDQTFDVPPRIANNVVDGTQINGDVSGGGQWGIRCDANGAQIVRNTVINALNGIVTYGAGLPSDVQNQTIANNSILTTAGSAQPFRRGIELVGASNVAVSGNTVTFASAPTSAAEISLIYVSGLAGRYSSGLTVTNNNIVSSLPASADSTGILLQWTGGWNIAGNTIEGVETGFHFLNLSGPATLINELVRQNVLQSIGQNVQITNGQFH